MKMNARHGRTIPGLAALAALVVILACLGGCQAIFTYSPLTALQRSPASLPPAQQLEYAQNALASGDKTAMTAALAVIKNDPSPAAQYTAAQLGIEVSGVPDLLLQAVDGDTSAISSAASIDSYLAVHPEIQPDYLIDAANRVAALSTSDPTALQPMDYVYGALGLALDAAKRPDGTFNVSSIPAPVASPPNATFTAQQFILLASTTLPAGDPTQAFLTAFSGLPNL